VLRSASECVRRRLVLPLPGVRLPHP